MKSLIAKYRWTLLNLLCVAVNVPFALTGHTGNTFALGWCSAFAFASFMEERR